MKHFLLTLMVLFVAGSAMADSVLYMDDISVNPGEQITVPVKAHFDGRVSAFQLDLTYSQGLTPESIECGEDMTISYMRANGSTATQRASFMPNAELTRCMATFMDAGYWDPHGDGEYEQYGVIKWEAGDYNEMLLLTLNIEEDFQGGEIMLQTQVASGSDTRGGTVAELGQTDQVFNWVCNVTVVPEPEPTPDPEIFYEEGETFCTITAVGEGDVRLYIDGVEVENPFVIARTTEEQTVVAQATAQINGQLISNMVEMVFVIPSIPVPPVPVDDYALTMEDDEVLHGRNIVIPVSMTNAEPVTAFQTDLYLPEGFELLDVVLSSRKSDDHFISRNTMADGATRILCYSMSLNAFEGNEGELFYITVGVPNDAAGDYTLMLKKSLLTTASDNVEIRCDEDACNLNVWSYIPGDVNGDGEVTVSDIVATAQYILGNNPQPFIFEAADMNGDGEITVTDVVLIVRLILNPSIDDLVQMRAPAVVGENNDAMSGEAISIADGETRTMTIDLDNMMSYTAFQLDMQLPDGLTAKNFRLTNRADGHTIDANVLEDGTQRVMCYSPLLNAIDGNEGALLSFEVTAVGDVNGEILVDGIEMVTTACQTVNLDSFAMKVNNATTSVKDVVTDLSIYTDGKNIIVETSVAQRVIISDVAGHAYTVDVPEGRTVIPARNSGVVVVCAGDKTAKLMIK